MINQPGGPLIGAEAVRELTSAGAMMADVENDGDRGPRLRDPLASIDAAAQGQHARAMVDLVAASLGLHVDEVRVLVWIARTLPGLEDRCRALKMEGAEPVYQPDGSLTPNDFGKATPRAHVVLGSLLSFVRDWQNAHDPYRGREVDPRAAKVGDGQ